MQGRYVSSRLQPKLQHQHSHGLVTTVDGAAARKHTLYPPSSSYFFVHIRDLLFVCDFSMSSLRPPRPNYQNTNGFVDPVLKDSEEILNAPVPPGVKLTDVQKARRERKIRDAVEVHRAVEDVLEIKGSYFPG